MRLLGGGRARRRGNLAGAESQEHFFPDRVVEVFELERRFTLVAQYFDHGRTAFVIPFHARVIKAHDVHLQSLHKKVVVVTPTRTAQRHVGNCMEWLGQNGMKIGPFPARFIFYVSSSSASNS